MLDILVSSPLTRRGSRVQSSNPGEYQLSTLLVTAAWLDVPRAKAEPEAIA